MAHKDTDVWIQTRTGIAFTPLDPQPDQISIEDIAQALGKLCRFNGHTDRFYSVAEHCVRMSYTVHPQSALWALLHDAGEAYISDIASPMKHLAPALVTVEDDILVVIANKFIADTRKHPLTNSFIAQDVHRCDKWIVHEEAKIMMKTPPRPWWPQPYYSPYSPPFPVPALVGWDHFVATAKYRHRFEELTRAAST